jgi:hypothetical protein
MSDDRRIRAWVERLSLVVIVASVSALAYPKYGSLQREKAAAQMLADVDVVRGAVYRFYSDSAYFPALSPGEPIPGSLAAYLPPRFSLDRPYGAVEYRNWPMRTDSAVVQATNVVGITVTVSDGRIGAAAMRLASPRTAKFAVGDKYTFLFFGT